jgi:hypothetical protein
MLLAGSDLFELPGYGRRKFLKHRAWWEEMEIGRK